MNGHTREQFGETKPISSIITKGAWAVEQAVLPMGGIDENGGGPGVRLHKSSKGKGRK